MTSKERILAAMCREEVDRVPVVMDFWTAEPEEQMFSWGSPQERIEWDREWGFDSCLYLPSPWEGSGAAKTASAIEQRVWQESAPDERYPILCSEWTSPKGTLTSKVRKTDDYPFDTVHFFQDFNTPRYVEPLLSSGEDLLTFIEMDPYQLHADRSYEEWRAECKSLKQLARREGVALGCGGGTALDYLIWAARAEEAIFLAIDYPEETLAFLEYLNDFSDRRVELCLEAGADFVIRRGWYESADFWSPKHFTELAAPFIQREADIVHQAGALSVYLMCTGTMPMLPGLNELDFDCLQKTEPVLDDQDLKEIVSALGERKSFWTGLSAPMHIGLGSQEDVREAVRAAFDIFGQRGFLLMAVPSVRRHWPWKENISAMMDEYRAIMG
ncbi:MAG: uroporphyrinogen decarboxylase family protein [Planctomycetota bacterium]|nr:uroporphyrinogen decarboxylase family protein [Planctomycetota bacterium]